jgi:APA family basic amino acid/polyamine antiporter
MGGGGNLNWICHWRNGFYFARRAGCTNWPSSGHFICYSLIPVSGASYIATSRLISPFFGFIYMWLVLAGVIIGIAVVALGFAHYFNELVPGLNPKIVAVLAVLFFGGLNLLGTQASVSAQAIMVLIFMLVLVIFTFLGSSHVEPSLLSPFMPNGFSAVLNAAIPAYFSYIGFQIIIEIGGEVKQPSKNIPLALLISFLVVLVTYIAVSLVIVGIIPWQELAKTSAPFAVIAEKIMPSGAATIISLTVLAAAASSINGLLFGFSRDVMMLSKVGMLPKIFGKVDRHSGEPINGVMTLTLLAVFTLLLGGSITDYVIVTVLGIMFGQILLGCSLIRLPKKMAKSYQHSQFKLGPFFLPFFAYGLMLFSLLFLVVGIISSTKSFIVAFIILVMGGIYFHLRNRHLTKQGVDVKKAIEIEVIHV